MILKRAFLIINIFLFPYILFAQIDTITAYVHDPVIISGLRRSVPDSEVPGSVFLIREREIQGMQQTVSLEESLREIPGVFVNNRYNFSQGDRISIRGLGSRSQFGLRSMKVLLDGIPLTFPDGTTQLNNLNLASVGRIEILKGPWSSLYGNSAAGVIILHTETTDTVGFRLAPGISAGSYGFIKAQLEGGGSLNRSEYFLSMGGTNFEGFREFSQARFYNANAVVKHSFSEKTRITGVLNIMDAPYLFNPGGLTRDEAMTNPEKVRIAVKKMVAGKDIKQQQAGVKIENDFGALGTLKSSVYGINRTMFNPIFGRVIELERLAGGIRNVWEKKFEGEISRWNFLSGLDLEFQRDERKEFDNPGVSEDILREVHFSDLLDYVDKGKKLQDQNEIIYNVGSFLNLSYKFRKRVSVIGGLRYDYYSFVFKDSSIEHRSVNLSQLSPSAGLIYTFSEKISAYLNFSTAFQTPTANEFSNSPDGAAFNTGLQPERIKSYEAGFRKSGRKIQADFSLFYFTVSNQLIAYQLNDTDITYYRNAGETQNSGGEFWIRYYPFSILSFTLSYTRMNYIFTDYLVEAEGEWYQLKGNKVPGVPAERFLTGVMLGGKKGPMFEMEVQYTGAYFVNDFNGPVNSMRGEGIDFINSSYWLTDVKTGYKLVFRKTSLLIFGGVNNLFDIRYNGSVIPNAAGNRFFEPAPGRNYYIGLNLPFTP